MIVDVREQIGGNSRRGIDIHVADLLVPGVNQGVTNEIAVFVSTVIGIVIADEVDLVPDLQLIDALGNRPVPSFFWKKTDSSTPGSHARNADFCTTMGLSGRTSTARIEPGKWEAKAIMPWPPSAVYRFWKRDSPENIRPNILPTPPPTVSICIFGLIQLIAPDSQTTDSPGASVQITTGKGSPLI